MVFHVPLLSGFTRQHPEPTDPRLVTYVLERNHRWMAGERPQEAFWSPPFFHPWAKVGTHTESMLGLQPFYSPWRLLGTSPETAYALCGLGLLASCFAAAVLFLRTGADLSPLAAAAGAFVFAFSLPRSAHLGHFQLYAHYATPLALLAVVSILRSAASGPPRRSSIWWLAGASWLQLLGSVYLVWFLVFLLTLAALGALGVPRGRTVLARTFRNRWGTWLAVAVVTGLAAWPVVMPYWDAESRVRANTFEKVQPLLPTWQSLFNAGADSWEGQLLGGGLAPPAAPGRFPDGQVLFPGVLTLGLAVTGFWLGRRRPLVRWSVTVAAVALGLTLVWPGGFSAWSLLYPLLPGAGAIRGVSRVGLPLLLVCGLGVGVAIEKLAERRRGLAFAACALMALEQGQTQRSFAVAPVVARSRRIAAKLPAECGSFLYTVRLVQPKPLARYHLEAMWAGLFADRPTVNGYSGYPPRGWGAMTGPFLRDEVGPLELPRLAGRLATKGPSAGRLCWLLLEGGPSDELLGTLSATPPLGDGPPGEVSTAEWTALARDGEN